MADGRKEPKSKYTLDRGMPGAFEGETVTRRRFMTLGAHGAGAVAVMAFTLPALGFAAGSALFDRPPVEWKPVGATGDFPDDTYVPRVITEVAGIGQVGTTTVYVRQTFASGPPRRIVVVSGEHGSVSVDLLAARITTDSNAISAVACGNNQRNQMFVDEIRHFMACIAGHERPNVPLDHGIAVLRLALAVKDAMRTGRTIEVA